MAIFKGQLVIIAAVALTLNVTSSVYASLKSADAKLKRRNYPAAASAYFNVYSAPQSKTERIKAEWGLAKSLAKLGLYYSASKYYSIIVRRGRRAGNPFFRSAMEELGRINSKVSLGQSHIVQLFKAKIRSSDVPGPARGFFFYYKGVEAFAKSKLEMARNYFIKVPSGSSYYVGATFHLGVIANLSGSHSRAISYFEDVLKDIGRSRKYREMREMALMNIGRVHYERKNFPAAIGYYVRIPRDSDHWLDAIWETSWAFFFMEKFNNALGQVHTLHSPFFINRFYPESYILQAIVFLRLCRHSEVKRSMKLFKKRYAPVYGEIKSMLQRYSDDHRGFYKLVYNYTRGKSKKYKRAEEIIKKLSLVDAFKGARDTVHFSSREIAALRNYSSKWASSGLHAVLKDFLFSKKAIAVQDAGRRMFKLATTYYHHLIELSNQTRMIVAEMQLGKLAKLRTQISTAKTKTKIQFIGGMQALKLNQDLEYWPFEKEYWEDELGFYVYNLPSKCSKK